MSMGLVDSMVVLTEEHEYFLQAKDILQLYYKSGTQSPKVFIKAKTDQLETAFFCFFLKREYLFIHTQYP